MYAFYISFEVKNDGFLFVRK